MDEEHVEEEENAGEEEESNFIERPPSKEVAVKVHRKPKPANSAGAPSVEAADKMPIGTEEVEMEDLQSSADTYEVITFEDVKDEAADDVKPKSRQSYAKKARLSIVGTCDLPLENSSS